jgi:hypothetical protein
MHRKSMRRRLSSTAEAIVLAVFILFSIEAVAVAQPVPGVPDGKNAEVAADALVCWWKTDKSSIRIGEEFTVTLTCRSAETGRERTVLNDSLLDPAALALPPYQVKGGARFKEFNRVLPGPDGPVTFRHVQYAYRVTLLGEGFFGKDVPLPPLDIRYHIDLVTNKDIVAPGKERTYALPPLPMRIQSLVPRAVNVIRDAGNETFGDIERRRKSAIIAFIAAGIFLLLPLAVMLPILVRAIHGRRESVANSMVFGERDLLRRLAVELDRVEKKCRTATWDDAAVGSALAVFRVAGALAIGRRIAQAPVALETCGREGHLEFRKGFWPRTKVLVSASLTPEEMAKELAGANWQGIGKARRKALLEETHRAFAALNDARYATAGNPAVREALDGALKKETVLLRALRRDRYPVVRMARTVADWWARRGRQWKRS